MDKAFLVLVLLLMLMQVRHKKSIDANADYTVATDGTLKLADKISTYYKENNGTELVKMTNIKDNGLNMSSLLPITLVELIMRQNRTHSLMVVMLLKVLLTLNIKVRILSN